MIARIEFESSIITKEDLHKLEYLVGEDIDTLPVQVDEEGKKRMYYHWESGAEELTPSDTYVAVNGSKTYVADIVEIAQAVRNVSYKVKSVIKHETANTMMSKINDKLLTALERFDKQVEFNSKCEVHVPNLGLININELMLAENICTDELQTHLNKGYRIIAVAPQPDQRRPDYILGRYNPGYTGGDEGAGRA